MLRTYIPFRETEREKSINWKKSRRRRRTTTKTLDSWGLTRSIDPCNFFLPLRPITFQFLITTPSRSSNFDDSSIPFNLLPINLTSRKPHEEISFTIQWRSICRYWGLFDFGFGGIWIRGWRWGCGCSFEIIGIEVLLGKKSEMGKNRWVPLGQMFLVWC